MALTSGTTLGHTIDDVRGGPARPFDRAMVLAKFRDNARRKLTDEAVDTAIREIDGLEAAPDLHALTAALRGLG